MDKHLALRSTGRFYRPLTAPDGVAADLESGVNTGPFTKDQVLALIWRVKKIKIVAEMSYTKEVLISAPEDPAEYEEQSFTKNIDVDMERIQEFGEDAGPAILLTKEQFLSQILDSQMVIFTSHTATEEDPDITAGWNFSFGLSGSMTKDENDGYWMNYGIVASDNSEGDDLRWYPGEATPGGTEIDFTGTFVILGITISIPMHSFGGVLGLVSTDSASFAATVTEWYPYATSTGAPAWSSTTGAPINGGPGA